VTSLIAIVGSVTPPGRLRRAVDDAVERLHGRQGTDVRVIDLAEVTLGFADGRPPEAFDDDTAATVEAIAAADAVVLATPVYRGSFTGSLKNLIDVTPVEALHGKPTAIVAMGATNHHFLGADRHLRDVLTFFGALVTPVSVYLSSADFVDGKASPDASADLDLLLDNLVGTVSSLSRIPRGPLPLGARKPPK
jgi:FMN reductase